MTEYPHPEYIAHRRASSLARCLKFRAFIKEGDRVVRGTLYTAEFTRFVLRKEQMNLLRLRIWRSTGEYPAEH